MKNVLVDANVVLDVLLDRQPHVEASAAMWATVEKQAIKGLMAAHAVTTIYYLMRKELGNVRARRTIAALLRVFGIAPVDERVIQIALDLPLADFEDAVTASAAQVAGCDYIVTRDPKGFRGCGIRALMPETFAAYDAGKTEI
ncbi:MAG TPA: PIN domain-containing protein [Bryobacteraceae bacterium]|nr:PIN domain-containing protein [Bryobacteraceae bacterium]